MAVKTLRQSAMMFLVLMICITLLLNTILAVPLGLSIITTTTPDSVGEAFRKQLSDSDRSGTGSNGRIFIDRLSVDEINEYQRTRRLPSRTEALIRDFLHKSPEGQELLHLESSQPTPTSDPVALQPSDRYEIVRDGEPIMMPNEDDFNPAQPSLTSFDQRQRRRRRVMNNVHN